MNKKFLILLIFILILIFLQIKSLNKVSTPIKKIDFIEIQKSKRIMQIYNEGKLLKTYKIALGFSPYGHKEKEGDGKTPEGIYSISYKNSKSRFYLSLKISYPNEFDKKNAQIKGISPGGDIYIHGIPIYFSWIGKYHTKKDWTRGCIAVTNNEIKEIFNAVLVGTKVEINL
jgi:murein L,D-transpeptidase YafK